MFFQFNTKRLSLSGTTCVLPILYSLFPVTLGHPRLRISKMALSGPSLLTVKVKSSDPRDSANDQKSQPRADLLRQNPPPMPGLPPSPPSQQVNINW